MSMKTKDRGRKQRIAWTSGQSITPQASKGEVGARRRLAPTGLEAQMEFKLKERTLNVYENKGVEQNGLRIMLYVAENKALNALARNVVENKGS